MSLKNVMNFSLANLFAIVAAASTLVSGNANANSGMWGSGYWGGMQGCGYPNGQGTNASSVSDEEKEEKRRIADLQKELKAKQLEKKRAETEMEFAARKLERQFDGEILEFLLEVHIEKGNQCNDYKTFPGLNCNPQAGSTSAQGADQVTAGGDAAGTTAVSSDCGSKDDVPAKLQAKWTAPNGYCTANSEANKGLVSASICADKTLKPDDRRSSAYSTTECSKQLNDYRKYRIKRDVAQTKIERIEDEIRDRQYAVSDARERAKIEREYRLKMQLEGDCEECAAEARGYSYEKPKRDWTSIIGTIGIGLGMGFLGKKYDEAAMEQQAQLGYPPQQGYPTAVSMGLPFVLAGAYGAINGGSGLGGFGCGAGMGGSGFPYGAGGGMGGPFGGPMGAYGPYGPGGAFGYPQGMFGSPWGGGMYPPGYGPGGIMAGPNGGWPGGYNNGFAVNGIVNGGLAMNGGGGYPMPGYMMGAMGQGMIPGAMQGYMASGQFMMPGQMMPGYMGAMGAMGQGQYMMPGQMMPGAMANMMPGYMGAMGAMGQGQYMMPGQMMPGAMANMMPGYMMPGAMAQGQYMMPGYMMPGAMAQGQLMMPGQMMPGQYMMPGQMANGSAFNNPQYQLQMLQIQQQQAQMQAQYYQAQMQAQQQQYQRQVQIQQQAAQVTQEIQALQMRLQMLYSGAYSGSGTGGGYYGVGGGTLGGSIGIAAPSMGSAVGGGVQYATPPPFTPAPVGQYPQNPTYPTGGQVTVPSPGGGR